jgi:hypothetical protein
MSPRTRIRCTVVAIPLTADRWTSRGALARDLLPWADPYVAGLIKRLQDEVRRERRFQSMVRHYRPTHADSAGGATPFAV